MRRLLVCGLVAGLVLWAAAPARSLARRDPGLDWQWGLTVVRAPDAWQIARGDGAVVAIVDSGVDLVHEDLRGKLVPGWDFVEGDAEPQDRNGHGTHLAGVAAAATYNGRGVAGVAPDARIMPVRVIDAVGDGNPADLSAGVRWAVDNGADVVVVAPEEAGVLLGSGLADAVRYAWERGVVPVVAAGNDYVLSSEFGMEPAVVVAATTRDNKKPAYSNGVGAARWGMAAPGGEGGAIGPNENDILSTWWGPAGPDQYDFMAGTAVAAPHVAGAAALLAGMGLEHRDIVSILLDSARDIGDRGVDSTFGHGQLDVTAAAEAGAALRDALAAEAASVPAAIPAPAADIPAPPAMPAAVPTPAARTTAAVAPPAAAPLAPGAGAIPLAPSPRAAVTGRPESVTPAASAPAPRTIAFEPAESLPAVPVLSALLLVIGTGYGAIGLLPARPAAAGSRGGYAPPSAALAPPRRRPARAVPQRRSRGGYRPTGGYRPGPR